MNPGKNKIQKLNKCNHVAIYIRPTHDFVDLQLSVYGRIPLHFVTKTSLKTAIINNLYKAIISNIVLEK